jgi:hypothetical protein
VPYKLPKRYSVLWACANYDLSCVASCGISQMAQPLKMTAGAYLPPSSAYDMESGTLNVPELSGAP